MAYNSASADSIWEALNGSGYSHLPYEIRAQIDEGVPSLANAHEVARLRARARRNAAQQSTAEAKPAADPRIPPQGKGNTPFLQKLPPEIRRMILVDYILPSKATSIEPLKFQKRTQDFERKRMVKETFTRRNRNFHQQNHQTYLQSLGHWQNQLMQPTPNPNQQIAPPFALPALQPPQPPQQQANMPGAWPQLAQGVPIPAAIGQVPVPQIPTAQVTFAGGPLLTGNPLNWQGNPLFQGPAPPAPPFAVNQQLWNAHAPVPQPPPAFSLPPHPFQLGPVAASAPAPVPIPSTVVGESAMERAARLRRQAAAHRAIRKYDDAAERMVIPLMRACQQLCFEVSKIMYEEYTFEIHIHYDGVELLGFDRIPTLENWGAEIEKTMGAFKSEKHFCFQRMKHLDFVYFGPNPKDRLAALRMRETTRKLVSFLKKEKKPLTSVKVSFEYEKKDNDEVYGVHNAITDEFGTFWTSDEKIERGDDEVRAWRDPRSSIFHDAFNVQLVSSPLKNLHGVSKVAFQYPHGIGSHEQLAADTRQVMGLMKTTQISLETQEEIMREEMIMDARRDKELELAGAGGYYKLPQIDAHGEYMEASEFLVTEQELEEEGLLAPFEYDNVLEDYRGDAMRDIARAWRMDPSPDVEMAGAETGSGAAFTVRRPDSASAPASLASAGSLNNTNGQAVEQSNTLTTSSAPTQQAPRPQRQAEVSFEDDRFLQYAFMGSP